MNQTWEYKLLAFLDELDLKNVVSLLGRTRLGKCIKGRVMEGVENINSVNTGGTSTVSTESQDLAPGQNDTEKKNHMFRHVVGLTHIFSTTTIKGVKMIKVVCKTEDAANKVMAKTIVVDNLTKFSKIESFTQNQPDLQSNFENKIWNVLLDIEKDLFEQHLLSLGQVKKIKFAVKNLYYEVSVTFVNKDLAGALKEEWSIKFLNKTFRIFPSTLTKEERNHCFKYVLKLTNLPKETNGGDLLEIVTCTRAKVIFVPKNRFSQNYEKERFA
ncbi:hypothetical protein RclHR1_13650002 [Rhizophagus clarus]|uniref:Uncharacterized protein n=1 Tax=Rhizophagus clarus TaxID=94130 RepID=A0A2Z6R325_9GLOM|nr:hypothetical protein RclHR1_13650002 [Rhizophagus clarus]